MEAEGENVIYVQVDEHGRVLNYTTNMPGGEQVILLQEGGDESNQQIMYQPQQLVGEQQQIIQPAHSAAAAQPTTQIIQAPDSSLQASNLIQDPSVQAQIMAQASSDAMVIQASTASVNSASKIIETAFSQATNEVPPTAQATIIDGSGNRILVADESQIPMQLMTSSAPAPIILSNEQAQILIAGTTTQQQQQRRPKPGPQRTTPTIVAGKGNRMGRSLISPAARNLVASQRSAIQVTSPRSLPAALQPSPQQILVGTPSQTATTTVSASIKNKDALAAFESVENIVMDELVSGRGGGQDAEVVRLDEVQELSDHVDALEHVSQAERDLLQAAKEEQEKHEKLDTDVPMPQDDMLQIDENPNAADQNAQDNTAIADASGAVDEVLNQDQTNIPIPEADIPMPQQPSTDQQDEQTLQVESIVPTTASDVVSEQAQVSLTASSEPMAEAQITTDSGIDSTPAEISVSLAKLEETEAEQAPESSVEQAHDQSISEATQLNGNIFANDEEDMETDDQIQAVVVTTVPVQQSTSIEQVPKENEAEEEEGEKPSQDIGETYAKIMELSNKFDNKYAEITGTKKPAVEHETLFVAAKDKPVKKITVTSHVSKIVPRDRIDDNDTDGGKDVTESDDDFEFKPQGVGRPKKTYEGIASRKRQPTDKQDSSLDQSIAERRARRKIKPSTRNIDMSDMKADSTEDDTEDEGLIIEPDKPTEKRGRGRPRKYPQEAKPGIGTSSIIITPGTAVISPGKAVQVTSAHMSPPRIIVTPKTVSEAMSNKAATVSSPKPTVKDVESPKAAAVDSEKRGRGRPRKVDTQPAGATPGSSTEQQPDVTSSSDQFSDADPAQKSFMASFSLMTAAQRAAKEEESKRRRSKRVSSQAEQKSKEDEEEEEEAKPQVPEPEKKSDNIFDIFDSPKVDPIGEIQSLRDDVDDLKDVNSQLLSKLSTTEADTDVKSLQAKVRKLQTVNAELKTRLRTYETKSASTKFTERNEIKSLQAKVEKLNNQNTDLKSKVTDIELSRVAVPQTVDKKGVVHKLKSPRASKHVDKTPTKMGSHDLEEWDAELQARTEGLDKKEQKLKILDRELDERTAMLKAKEGKLARNVQQLKTKEKELEYRERQMERSANQNQTDRKSKQGMEQQLELREVAIEEKEKELEVRETLLGTTQQQLQALGQELKEKFEYLQSSGQDVSEAKAELENQMAESAAKVKATTAALRRSAETVKKSAKKRADSPASSRGSTKGSTPAQVKQRRDSGRSQSSDTKKGEKPPNSKSRRSVAKPRKYSPSPEPKRQKAVKKSDADEKDGGAGKVIGTIIFLGKDEQKSAEDTKNTRVSTGKRARRETSPNPQAAKKKKV